MNGAGPVSVTPASFSLPLVYFVVVVHLSHPTGTEKNTMLLFSLIWYTLSVLPCLSVFMSSEQVHGVRWRSRSLWTPGPQGRVVEIFSMGALPPEFEG